MPPTIACRFTGGEQAVLAVVAREMQKRQVCTLPVDAIAASAGVSRSTAKNAIREARKLGLIEVRERRIPGRPSLTNVIQVLDRAWLGWLRLGAGGVGVRKLTATDTCFSSVRAEAVETQRGAQGIRGNPARASVVARGDR